MADGGGQQQESRKAASASAELPGRAAMLCVTGATGYLASWLVMRLLERGYHVRGTFRDPAKTGFLTSLPGATERLELVQADLMDEVSLAAAVQGCSGVFALAVPLSDPSEDQSHTIELALTATRNLLQACCNSDSVKKVVWTSTFFTAIEVPHDDITTLDVDESCWTSVEYCRQKKMPCWGYMVAKTISEQAAIQFAKEKGLDLVTILPSMVGGPFLTSRLPDSVAVCGSLMTGAMSEWITSLVENMSYVHVEDCIRAHILLMENAQANGRYLCSACDATFRDVCHESIAILDSFKLPKEKLDCLTNGHSKEMFYKLNTNKLKDLGFIYEYDTLRQILQETALCMMDKGLLS